MSIKAQHECLSGRRHRAHGTQPRADCSDWTYPEQAETTSTLGCSSGSEESITASDFKECYSLSKKNIKKFHIYTNIENIIVSHKQQQEHSFKQVTTNTVHKN